MTDVSNTSRRAVLVGGLAALGLGLAAVVGFKASTLFRLHYAPTPYDDLLSRLTDRENADRIGGAELKKQKNFNAQAVATQLRARLNNNALADVLAADLEQRRLTEVHGWVLPETLATLCALAAKVMPVGGA